jgi:hypothetical protein
MPIGKDPVPFRLKEIELPDGGLCIEVHPTSGTWFDFLVRVAQTDRGKLLAVRVEDSKSTPGVGNGTGANVESYDAQLRIATIVVSGEVEESTPARIYFSSPVSYLGFGMPNGGDTYQRGGMRPGY